MPAKLMVDSLILSEAGEWANKDGVAIAPFPNEILPDAGYAATAIIYCEAKFGELDGKTANGLVRYSEKYEILSVSTARRPAAMRA